MIFHDRVFLLFALPALCVAFAWISRGRSILLTFFSLAMVAHAGLADLAGLALSMTFNLAIAHWAIRCDLPRRRWLITIAIAINIVGLIFSKTLCGATALGFVPLGISFYTFQQIGFLVEVMRGTVAFPLTLEYVLIVSFFPHLAAGPIVRFRDLLAQIRGPSWSTRSLGLTTANLVLLMIGLSKKLFIADQLAPWVTESFDLATQPENTVIGLSQFLWATFGYGLQIYFDFSGYSDIAVALGLMFGIQLPINFNSPYQSKSVIEFWRRWHISLSDWIREFLYLPLKRQFPTLPLRPLLLIGVMGVVGLWHGICWSFFFWGIGHGLLLALNHISNKVHLRIPRPLGQALTLASVNLLWLLFRGVDLEALKRLVRGATLYSLTPQTLWLALGLAAVIGLPNSAKIHAWVNTGAVHRLSERGLVVATLALAAFGAAIIFLADYRAEFIYFRF